MRVALNEAYTATDQVKSELIVGSAASATSKLSCDLMRHRMEKLHEHFEEHVVTSPTKLPGIALAQDRMQRYLVQHISHTRQLSNIVKVVVCAFVVILGALYVAFQLTIADTNTAQIVQGFLGSFFVTFIFSVPNASQTPTVT
mmetsp:Transcript_87860/g.231490  ORF Transcript_87860/g.231490 Transcript_87860/m.231490 type:complete len:143 (+) Transcript_87860:1-429(+)